VSFRLEELSHKYLRRLLFIVKNSIPKSQKMKQTEKYLVQFYPFHSEIYSYACNILPKRAIECWYGTSLSAYPRRRKVGLVTFFMFSKLLKRSRTIPARTLPTILAATYRKLLKGLISSNAPGLYFAARWVAGPDPIDLPKRMILLWGIFSDHTKYS